MFYQNEQEQKHVESIMNRITDKTMLSIYPGSYGKCRVFATESFKNRVGSEAGDVITLLLIYLFSMNSKASKYFKFSFENCFGEIIDFFVRRNDEKQLAEFFLEGEIEE